MRNRLLPDDLIIRRRIATHHRISTRDEPHPKVSSLLYCIYTIAILRRRKTAASFHIHIIFDGFVNVMRVRACDIYIFLLTFHSNISLLVLSNWLSWPSYSTHWNQTTTTNNSNGNGSASVHHLSHTHTHTYVQKIFCVDSTSSLKWNAINNCRIPERHRKNCLKYELFTIVLGQLGWRRFCGLVKNESERDTCRLPNHHFSYFTEWLNKYYCFTKTSSILWLICK